MSIIRFKLEDLLEPLQLGKLILVPNHRIQDAILSAFAEHRLSSNKQVTDSQPWRTPQVFAIDIWIREQWELAGSLGQTPCCNSILLDSSQELLLWTAIIEKDLPQLPLLNPETTATLASHSYQLLRLWLLEESNQQSLHELSAVPDIAAFAGWLKSYTEYCTKRHCISLVDATLTLSQQLPDTLKANLPTELLLVNFYQTPPLYEQLFKQFSNYCEIQELHSNSGDSNASKTSSEHNDRRSELSACARWAQQISTTDPASHIGIIANSNSALRNEFEQIFSDILEPEKLLHLADSTPTFNSSTSNSALGEHAVVHDAFLLLNLCLENQDSNELCRLLRSPYIDSESAEEESRLQMELFMRRRFINKCNGSDFSWHLNNSQAAHYSPQLAKLVLNVRTQLRNQASQLTTSDWAVFFSNLLDSFAWPGSQLSELERTLLKQWQEMLKQFAESQQLLGKITLSTALSKLHLLCRQQMQRQHYQPDNPFSFYSLDEAVGLRFDHLWILEFDDQKWPAAINPSPFIPYAWQKAAGLPGSHSEIQLQRAEQNLSLLCQSTKSSIIASYHITEGEQRLRPSRLIQQFTQLDNSKASDSKSSELSCLNQLATETLGKYLVLDADDSQPLALSSDEEVRGGQSVISNQSTCPFRAFGVHRLHARSLNEFPSGLSPMERGTAVHNALDKLFENIESLTALEALDNSEKEKLTTQAAQHAVELLGKQQSKLMTPRFKLIEQQRIKKLLASYLQKESSRGAFQLIAREQEYAWQYKHLGLKIKVDRIDQLNDGSLALIDYKTGKSISNKQSWLEDRPEDMQLPLYFTITNDQHEEEITAISIAQVNVEKMSYSGISANNNFHPTLKAFNQDEKLELSWTQLTESWQDKVAQFADEFCVGTANVSPANGRSSCTYCDLQGLCRIQELSDSIEESDSIEHSTTEDSEL